MNFMETYNASEGFFGIQDNALSDDMLLMLDYGIFYEFIPMEEWDHENPQTLTLQEVEVNQPYAVVISTNGGLWRYNIGDTVRFTSLSPYRIKITGRTKQFINIAGEELMVENAEIALNKTCSELQSEVREFTVCPIKSNHASGFYHHWMIEFKTAPEDLSKFEKTLDDQIRQMNSDYDAKRAGNMNLQPLQIEVVPEQTFLNWMKYRGKLGGQNKVPRLHSNDLYVRQIHEFIHA